MVSRLGRCVRQRLPRYSGRTARQAAGIRSKVKEKKGGTLIKVNPSFELAGGRKGEGSRVLRGRWKLQSIPTPCANLIHLYRLPDEQKKKPVM